MPTYVYGCDEDNTHPRQEVVHGMQAVPIVTCSECGSSMHKVPQSMRFYMNPQDTLTSWMDDNYIRKRTGQPVNEMNVARPGPGIPQKDFEVRKHKKEFI